MRILHTSDWHVGKVLKGQTRVQEQVGVLSAVVDIAREHQPDLVIVAGDLFDTGAPAPDSTRLVIRALSALRGTGAEVVAIAGNHDNGPALDALHSWAQAAGVTVRGTVRDQPAYHRIDGVTAGGERWRLVALPFLSQRYAVRATEMFELTAAEANQTYADHLARLFATLCEGFGADTVNLVTAHLTVLGGSLGGGERDAHTVAAYSVPATIFPASAHYVALGHLHRRQAVPGPCPVHYSGSPLAVDFGEQDNSPSVNLVEVSRERAARVTAVPVSAGRALRTVRGTLDELAALDVPEGVWLRVFVAEAPRAGLREAVQELLPQAVEVRIDPAVLATPAGGAAVPARRSGRRPGELFAEYLASRGHDDRAVLDLFDRLHGEVTG